MQRIAALYEQHGQRLSIATIEGRHVESHKRAAFDHYQGGRGYAEIALWAPISSLPTSATVTCRPTRNR